MGGMKVKTGADGAGMTTTFSQCITNNKPFPQREQDKDCQETHTIDGNTVNFEATCKDSKSTGQMTYKDDAMEGVITSQQTADGTPTNVTIEVKGQYTGPCS